jgi:hypothetical protein
VASILLQIDPLFYACSAKKMMTALHPFLKEKTLQHSAQFVETDRRVRSSAQNPSQRLGGSQTSSIRQVE